MRAIALLLMAWLSLTFPASAADDAAAAQSVISSQEQALGRDDSSAAYSYASPGIQKMFPGADTFMSMVQSAYPPIYRHKSFEFGETRAEGKLIAQRVHIVDEKGDAWEAMYTLEQQSDGSYKISGCTLLKAGQSV